MDLSILKKSITLCKEEITAADQNLEKLTGRNLINGEFYNQRLAPKKRLGVQPDEPEEIKKPRSDTEVPAISSVVNMTRGRTRNDALSELKKNDPREKERCKRILGHFLGTLNSIKKDSERNTHNPQTITRMKIEKKVEESNKIVIETIKKEQSELIRTKKEYQNDLKILNQRYRAAEAYECWKAEKEKMKGYIRTSSNPPIFYLPKIYNDNDETKLRIDQTVRSIDTMIENRKRRLENDIDKAVKLSEVHTKIVPNIKKEESVKDDLNSTEDKCPNGDSGNDVNEENDNKSKEEVKSFKDDESNAASEDYDDLVVDIELSMADTKTDLKKDETMEYEDNKVGEKEESNDQEIVKNDDNK